MIPDYYWFGLLTAEQVKEAWHVIEPILARAFKHGHGELTIEDVPPMIESGRLHAFVMFEKWQIVTVMLVEIEVHPHKRILNITALAGSKLATMLDLFRDRIIKFAHDNNATRITARCRPAAARLFNRLGGSKTIYVCIAKEI